MEKNSGKFRKYTAVVILVILAGSLAAFTLFMVRSYRRSARFDAALTAFEDRNYENARRLFLQVLSSDPNNEIANVKLAEISAADKFYAAAAYYYNTASNLNPLRREYRRKYYDSLFLARDFDRLFAIFDSELKMHNPVSGRDLVLYAVSAVRTGRLPEARRAYVKLLKESPEELKEPSGELLEFLFSADSASPETITAQLLKFTRSPDPGVAYEGCAMLVIHYQFNRAPASDIEGAARLGAQINPVDGTPVLAGLMIQSYRFNEAINLLENYLEHYPSLPMSMVLGELYFYTEQPEKLAKFGEKYNAGSKQTLLLGYYLQALQYAQANDVGSLSEVFGGIENSFQSPLFSLLALHVHLYRGDLTAVEKDALALRTRPEFMNINEKSRKLILGKIHDLTVKNDMKSAVRLAKAVDDPDKPELLISRLLVSDGFTGGTLGDAELQRALKEFPNDGFLLRIGAEYALAKDRPQQALEFLETFRNSYPEVDDARMNRLRTVALEKAGRLDAASQEYLDQLARHPGDPNLAGAYFEFAGRNQRKSDLKILADMLNKNTEEPMREFLPFISAEMMLLDQQELPALELLSNSRTQNPMLKFRAAYILGSHDRFEPAIRLYRELLAGGFNRPLILINLAELYNASGAPKQAAQSAMDAYKLAPENRDVQLCLARTLTRNGMTGELVETLKLSRHRADVSNEVLSLWRPAAEKTLKTAFADHRYAFARELTDRLLNFFPDNPVGIEYDRKLKALTKK